MNVTTKLFCGWWKVGQLAALYLHYNVLTRGEKTSKTETYKANNKKNGNKSAGLENEN